MRIASHFQRRRRWARVLPSRLALARASAGLLLFGCFFQLEEPVDLGTGGIGNNNGVGGTDGGSGGAQPGGGGGIGGSVSPPECPPGQKRCGEGPCIPMTLENGCGNPSCQPCAQPPQASVSCNLDTGACQVDACDFGHADCDGNLSTYTGDVAGNGCEYSFGTIQPVTLPLDVGFARIRLDDDGDVRDWSGIPAYPLQETCGPTCNDDTLPEITAQNEAPPKSDLDAYFRVAWDTDFFYVLAEAYDNDLFHEGLRLADEGNGQCQNGALCEDAFALFFDGRNNRDTIANSGNDDLRLFLGLAGKAFRLNGAPLSSGDAEFVHVVQQPFCYRLEAQISWKLIVDAQSAPVVDKVFPPDNGQEYGFDISVNDWDPSIADGTPQRQSQLFYVNPGNLYHQVATGFIPMVLSGRGGADAGP